MPNLLWSTNRQPTSQPPPPPPLILEGRLPTEKMIGDVLKILTEIKIIPIILFTNDQQNDLRFSDFRGLMYVLT